MTMKIMNHGTLRFETNYETKLRHKHPENDRAKSSELACKDDGDKRLLPLWVRLIFDSQINILINQIQVEYDAYL